MDKRIALPTGWRLPLPGMECMVEREIGRGSNAIVYKGWYADSLNAELKHHVLIKELFPYNEKGAVYRDGDGSICCTEAGQAALQLHSQSFVRGNEVHLRLREKYPSYVGGNANTFTLNGTYYSILDFTGGRVLTNELASPGEKLSLRRLTQRMVGLMQSLGVFHEMGYLHLDVSPENILLIDKGARERVELIDFNSVERLAAIAGSDGLRFNLKQGYSAPEARLGASGSINTWTDVFSATAVLYRCLMGRALSRMQLCGVLPVDVSASHYLADAPETVGSLVKHIVAKGLCSVVRRRYQTVDEMLVDLRELLDRIDGVGVTHWALWETSSHAVNREISANSALSHITDRSTLYPVSLEAPGDCNLKDFMQGCSNVVLTGEGGTGKTTLLLGTAWREGRRYIKDRPVALYLSLYGYREGDTDYIHDSILRRLRFKRGIESYPDARHALDLLLQKPMVTEAGERPVLCLLLDGYNEISGDASSLRRELERLTRMPGVRALIASRTFPAELPYEKWRLKPIDEGDVQDILIARGLLMPKEKQMRALLTNALMLSLYIRACGDAGEQIAVRSKDELIETYLDALRTKEMEALPDGSPDKWRLDAAMRCVYPMIAGMETIKRRGLTGAELLALMNDIYRQLGGRALIRLYPQWVGHASDIRGGAKDGEAWLGLIVNDLLWRRLGLLYQDANGVFMTSHQEFREALTPRARGLRRALERPKRLRRALLGTAALAAAVALCLLWPRQAPAYNAMKAIDALGYVQSVYMEMNGQYVTIKGLLENPTPTQDVFDSATFTTLRGFDGARKALETSRFATVMDADGDADAADDCARLVQALYATGERLPWGKLPFDGERFGEMVRLLSERSQSYLDYTDRLQLVYQRGDADDYKHYRALVDDVLAADARRRADAARDARRADRRGV